MFTEGSGEWVCVRTFHCSSDRLIRGFTHFWIKAELLDKNQGPYLSNLDLIVENFFDLLLLSESKQVIKTQALKTCKDEFLKKNLRFSFIRLYS